VDAAHGHVGPIGEGRRHWQEALAGASIPSIAL
jgi:hypothetical protein